MGFNSAFKGLIQVAFYRKMQYSSGLSFADVCAAEVYGKCTEGQAERTGLNEMRKGGAMMWYIVFCNVRFVFQVAVQEIKD